MMAWKCRADGHERIQMAKTPPWTSDLSFRRNKTDVRRKCSVQHGPSLEAGASLYTLSTRAPNHPEETGKWNACRSQGAYAVISADPGMQCLHSAAPILKFSPACKTATPERHTPWVRADSLCIKQCTHLGAVHLHNSLCCPCVALGC